MKMVFLLAATAAVLVVSPAAAQRVELPIRPVVLPDGVRRYAVTLQVNGQPVEAGLDTGSTGLRVLAAALPGGTELRGPTVRYSYGSGVQFTGPAVSVPVAAGPLSGKVRVERIDKVGCVDRRSDCAAEKVDAAAYRIQGDGIAGQGFDAIIGIGLRDDTVGNPLVALGARRWILELPRAGEAAGRLILNPDAAEVTRYRQFAFIGDTNQVAGCIAKIDGSARVCGPAMVDSGASGLRVQGGRADQVFAEGTPALIVFGDGKDAVSMPVTIGRRDQAAGMRLYPARPSGGLSLSFGIAPYLHWSVLYDAGARRIGVADR